MSLVINRLSNTGSAYVDSKLLLTISDTTITLLRLATENAIDREVYGDIYNNSY